MTSAVNRVIEDMNHEFLASVLTRPFRSSDLGIVSRQLLTDRDPSRRHRLDRMLDRGAVTAELMRYLDIRNAERQTVRVSDEDAESIKATEHAFGKVVSRTVLYRGADTEGRDGIRWRNVNAYLLALLRH